MSENDKKFDLSKFTFASGTELSNGELIMIGHPFGMDPGKNPKSVFLIRDTKGRWSEAGSVSWLPEGVSNNINEDSLFLIHWGGSCLEFNKTNNTFSSIYKTEEDKNDPPSELRFSKVIDGELFVGGTNRFLFQQINSDWKEISIEAMKGEPMPSSFENITGFNSQELYAFGWEGVIWTNKGGKWKEIESPTEDMLFDGDVFDDKVYIAGQMGIILEGRGDQWTELESEISEDDIDSVCTYKDAIYFSNNFNILRLKNGELELFLESTPEFSTSKLFTGPSGLWSVSDKHLALYDGKSWTIMN
jgi:hypothetical protein